MFLGSIGDGLELAEAAHPNEAERMEGAAKRVTIRIPTSCTVVQRCSCALHWFLFGELAKG